LDSIFYVLVRKIHRNYEWFNYELRIFTLLEDT
jgi:hypothetical protein